MDSRLSKFISTLPSHVAIGATIKPTRIILPIKLDPKPVYSKLEYNINSTSLTTEKAMYVASLHKLKKFKTFKDIMDGVLRYE